MAPQANMLDLKPSEPAPLVPSPLVPAPAAIPTQSARMAQLLPEIEALLQTARAEVTRARKILAILDGKPS